MNVVPAFNVIIDHDYMGEGIANIVTVTTRERAMEVLQADLDAYEGNPSSWRGFIEEVYVAGLGSFLEESRRARWHIEAARQRQADERAMKAAKPKPFVPMLRCETCGWYSAVNADVPYPGYHPDPNDQRCDAEVERFNQPVPLRDPYGNLLD